MSEIERFCEIALATNLKQFCSRYSDAALKTNLLVGREHMGHKICH